METEKTRLHITSSQSPLAALRAVKVPREVCRYRRGVAVNAYTDGGETLILKYTTLVREPKFSGGGDPNPFEALPCNGFFPRDFYDWRRPDKILKLIRRRRPLDEEEEALAPAGALVLVPGDAGYIDFCAREEEERECAAAERESKPRSSASAVFGDDEDEPDPSDILNANLIDNKPANEYELLGRVTVVLELVRTYLPVRDPSIVALLEKLLDTAHAALTYGDFSPEEMLPRRAALTRRAEELQRALREHRLSFIETEEENKLYLDALLNKCSAPSSGDFLSFFLQYKNPALTRGESETP